MTQHVYKQQIEDVRNCVRVRGAQRLVGQRWRVLVHRRRQAQRGRGGAKLKAGGSHGHLRLGAGRAVGGA